MLWFKVPACFAIAVDTGCRQRGIGKRLLRAAERWVKAQGAVHLLLDCHAANTPAIHFSEMLGYRVRGLILAKRGFIPNHQLPDRGW